MIGCVAKGHLPKAYTKNISGIKLYLKKLKMDLTEDFSRPYGYYGRINTSVYALKPLKPTNIRMPDTQRGKEPSSKRRLEELKLGRPFMDPLTVILVPGTETYMLLADGGQRYRAAMDFNSIQGSEEVAKNLPVVIDVYMMVDSMVGVLTPEEYAAVIMAIKNDTTSFGSSDYAKILAKLGGYGPNTIIDPKNLQEAQALADALPEVSGVSKSVMKAILGTGKNTSTLFKYKPDTNNSGVTLATASKCFEVGIQAFADIGIPLEYITTYGGMTVVAEVIAPLVKDNRVISKQQVFEVIDRLSITADAFYTRIILPTKSRTKTSIASTSSGIKLARAYVDEKKRDQRVHA
jgi:hypothetical protein